MKRLLLIVASLAGLAAWGQAASGVSIIEADDGSAFRSTGTVAPLFSFASPTAYRGYRAYAGLPASDGCYAAASVTGTKQEALTFTRATTRFCPTDGTTSEATGVMCASGEVCITSLSGKRGISIFRAATNLALRSQEINNAAYASDQLGVAAPTLNGADAAAGPDGTTTAEDYSFPATGSGQYSLRYQLPACNVGVCTSSLFVKGVSSSGSMDLCVVTSTGPTVLGCTTCEYNSSTYTRCTNTQTLQASTNGSVSFGNATNFNGGITRSSNRVYLWGLQTEMNAYVTPYIATAGASATRNAETATFPSPAGFNIAPASLAATRIGPAGSASQPNVVLLNVPAVSTTEGSVVSVLYSTINGLRCWNNGIYDQRVAFAAATEERAWCAFDPSLSASSRALGEWPSASAMVDGVTSGGSTAAAVDIQVGYFGGAASHFADGIVSNVCLDGSPARCR